MSDRAGFQPLSWEEQHEQNLRDLKLIREDPGWALSRVIEARRLEARLEELERAHRKLDGLRQQCHNRVEKLERALRQEEEAAAHYAARMDTAEARVRELREALVRLEEPCPDCEGEGCEWCGSTGFVFRDSSEMQEIRRAALAAVPPEPAAKA